MSTDILLGRLMAVGSVGLFLTDLPLAQAQIHTFSLWWNILGYTSLASFIVLSVAGARLNHTWYRPLWAFASATVLVAQLTWGVAYHGSDLAGVVPWIWGLEPAAISLAILWASPAFAIGYTILSSLTPLVAGFLAFGVVPHAILQATPIHTSNIAFVAIFIGIRSRITQVRKTEEEAHAKEVALADTRIRLGKFEELAQVVHDHVLATLIAAMRLPGSPVQSLRDAAARALIELDSVEKSTPDQVAQARTIPVADFAEALRRLTHDLTPQAELSVLQDSGMLPTEVAEKIALALAEALRNCVKHTPEDTRIVVLVELSSSHVSLSVNDDGPGFSTAHISPGRLGIGLGIERRMRSINAAAHIISGTNGTRVELNWTSRAGAEKVRPT